jgi:hypothetical protein
VVSWEGGVGEASARTSACVLRMCLETVGTDATRQQKQVLPSAQSSATAAPSIVTQDSQVDDKYEAEQFIIFKPLDRAVSWAEVCVC